MPNEIEMFQIRSGCNVRMSLNVYKEYYLNFNDNKDFYFETIVNSGLYFPQIMQFICVMFCICNGNSSFGDVFLCNLVSGIGFTVAWFILKLYRIIPGVCFLSSFIGGNIFRYYLHFIAIAVVSFFMLGDWKIIVYCLVGGLASGIVRPLLFSVLSTVNYIDQVTRYVAKCKM